MRRCQWARLKPSVPVFSGNWLPVATSRRGATMKPVRTADLTNVVPVDGRGKRSNETLLRIDERGHFFREAARRCCVGMRNRPAAAFLRTKLARYREGAWRRDRVEALCPARHRGTVTEMLWCVLKVSGRLVSERTIRRTLSLTPIRGPTFGM